MFLNIERTKNIKAGDKIEVYGHANHVAHQIRSGIVVSKTPTGRVNVRLDGNTYIHRFSKCGRGLGQNPYSIRSEKLTKATA